MSTGLVTGLVAWSLLAVLGVWWTARAIGPKQVHEVAKQADLALPAHIEARVASLVRRDARVYIVVVGWPAMMVISLTWTSEKGGLAARCPYLLLASLAVFAGYGGVSRFLHRQPTSQPALRADRAGHGTPALPAQRAGLPPAMGAPTSLDGDLEDLRRRSVPGR
jgi:hypothetical protein